MIAPVKVQIERDFPNFLEKTSKIPPSIDANRSQQVHTITTRVSGCGSSRTSSI